MPLPEPDTTQTERPAVGARVWLWLFVVAVVAQVLAVYWPRVTVEGPVTWTDKVAHLLIFALPALTGMLAGMRPAVLLGALALHAPLSEAVQHWVLPDRSGDPGDALADLAGVVSRAVGALVWRTRRRC